MVLNAGAEGVVRCRPCDGVGTVAQVGHGRRAVVGGVASTVFVTRFVRSGVPSS